MRSHYQNNDFDNIRIIHGARRANIIQVPHLSMKVNRLIIQVHTSVHELFLFTITPPNSTLWIPNVVKEKTNEWPVRIGTIYTLTTQDGSTSNVIVSNIKEDTLVEWVSEDNNYHCRYNFSSIDKDFSKLEYYEKVDNGELIEPFTLETLEKLKLILEK